MREDGTRYIFSLLSRVSKLFRRQAVGMDEIAGDVTVFGLLFREIRNASGSARIRMTDLSQYLMISKPAATQAVNRLVDLGLLQRTRDESDRRVVYIEPTPEGEALFEEKMNERMRFIEQVIDRIGEEKAVQLGSLLDEFVDAMVAESEEK